MDTGPGAVVVLLETVAVLEEAVAVTMAEVEVLVTLVDLVRVARTALSGGMFPRLFFFLFSRILISHSYLSSDELAVCGLQQTVNGVVNSVEDLLHNL